MEKTEAETITRGLRGLLNVGYKAGFGIGVIIGVSAMTATAMAIMYFSPPNVNYVRVLPSRQETSVMRLYREGTDGTFVRSPTDSTRYISLSDYLKHNFSDANERNLEKARIELLVSQEEDR